MDTEAPMAKPRAGWPLFFEPPEGGRHVSVPCGHSASSLPLATGASLSTEDDFEIGGEFLDVFVRSGERVAGFLAGCMLIGGIWIIRVAF